MIRQEKMVPFITKTRKKGGTKKTELLSPIKRRTDPSQKTNAKQRVPGRHGFYNNEKHMFF